MPVLSVGASRSAPPPLAAPMRGSEETGRGGGQGMRDSRGIRRQRGSGQEGRRRAGEERRRGGRRERGRQQSSGGVLRQIEMFCTPAESPEDCRRDRERDHAWQIQPPAAPRCPPSPPRPEAHPAPAPGIRPRCIEPPGSFSSSSIDSWSRRPVVAASFSSPASWCGAPTPRRRRRDLHPGGRGSPLPPSDQVSRRVEVQHSRSSGCSAVHSLISRHPDLIRNSVLVYYPGRGASIGHC